ncbi:MAG: nucleotide exchange factor GrpE [Cytophagales bacterium]|nr:nucleotide exchange factor GrpE [Cytophagales bacterium]
MDKSKMVKNSPKNESKAEIQGEEERTIAEEKTPAKGRKKTLKSLEKELEKAEEALAGSKDKYLRLYSEFENFRRRTAKERLALTDTANEALLKSLLPIVDDLERALDAFEKEDVALKTMQEGVKLIYDKLFHLLHQKDLKPMELKKGDTFSTELHEAITQTSVEEDMKGKVVDVIEKGYFLKDKVLRFAKVIIGV